MKFILYIFFLSLTTIGKTSAQKSQKGKSQRNSTTANANYTIRFANSVIDLGNTSLQTLQNFKELLSSTDSIVNTFRTTLQMPIYAIGCGQNSVNPNQESEYTASTQTAPPFEQKDYIISRVTQATSDFNKVKKSCMPLAKYFANKEYEKDTELKIYENLRNNFASSIETARVNWIKISEQATIAGQEAELSALKKIGSHCSSSQ